jgi:hypothetical protein
VVIATSSAAVRAAVARRDLTADEAVDLLSDAGDHAGRRDCMVACPECGAEFWRSDVGRWNTCSDPCQRARNQTMVDLDGGRSIVMVSDLTAERLADLFGSAGLALVGLGVPGPGGVVPS